jgi:AraC-like DNA-binding protein
MQPSQVPWSRWSSATFARGEQFAAWSAALDDSHLGWALRPPAAGQGYRASMEMSQLGETRVVRCMCEPCVGARTAREIGQGTEAYFGLLYLLSGEEALSCGRREAVLEPGSMLLWDSTQPMSFRFPRPLQKITLLVPQAVLRARLPTVDALIGVALPTGSGLGAIVAAHLQSLASQSAVLSPLQASVAADAALELLAAWAQPPRQGAQRSRDELLRRIQRYIECHLDDPELAPPVIAAACGVSLRYLHLLFAETGSSVTRWMRTRRLEQCRRELRVGGRDLSVTAVALRWGFADLATFSRAFKAEFGVSPRAYYEAHR